MSPTIQLHDLTLNNTLHVKFIKGKIIINCKGQ